MPTNHIIPPKNYRRNRPAKRGPARGPKQAAQWLPNIPGYRYAQGGLYDRAARKPVIDWSTLMRLNEREIRQTIARRYE